MARTSAHARCVLMHKVNGVEAFVVPPSRGCRPTRAARVFRNRAVNIFHHGSRCVRTDDAHIGVHASEQIM